MTKEKIKIAFADNDPIFQLGFCTALLPFSDLEVVAQTATAAETLRQLEPIPDLLVLGNIFADRLANWQLCQKINRQYPQLPVFLYGTKLRIKDLKSAKALGIRGYCSKGITIEALVSALRGVAAGQSYWQTFEEDSRMLPKLPSVRQSKWTKDTSRAGLRQIEAELSAIATRLKSDRLSVIDRLYWQGRKRELQSAAWFIQKLLSNEGAIAPKIPSVKTPTAHSLVLSSQTAIASNSKSIWQELVTRTQLQIQLGVENTTNIPLEIDILQPQKRQELLLIILDRLHQFVGELLVTVSPSPQEDLPEQMQAIIWQLWQSASKDFSEKNYLSSTVTADYFDFILAQDAVLVREYLFNKLYLALDLFAYLLGQSPLIVEGIPYRPEAPESLNRGTILLQNLILQIANLVMQVILNNFYDLELVKQNLYQPSYRSSREIARFRNNLSWRYRWERYWSEPKNIFESQYELLVLQNKKIKLLSIYAPRTAELELLRGIPWLTSIALETRDALAPRLRSVFAFLGSGLVYVLTQVIGRGIGLIGRGIMQGIGNTFQETRQDKDRDKL